MASTDLEAELYAPVGEWAKSHFRCFDVFINRGIAFGRVDVLGVRDAGGDLSGEVETLSIEVKRGATQFAATVGQALGYRIMTNLVYLADVRPQGFSFEEVEVARHLGVGLIEIRQSPFSCAEVLSSPVYQPIERLRLSLLEGVGLGRCRFCGDFFRLNTVDKPRGWSNMRRAQSSERYSQSIGSAISEEKGLVFWSHVTGRRKTPLHTRRPDDGSTWDRRFICPECVTLLYPGYE